MIIGNFTCNEARDTYTGELSTLTVAARKVVFQPIEAKGEKAPSHRIVSPSKAGDVEFGAAWKKAQRGGPVLPLGQARRSEPAAADELRPGGGRRQAQCVHPGVVERPAPVVRRRPAKPGRGRSARAAPSCA
jgi:hypothetical protein